MVEIASMLEQATEEVCREGRVRRCSDAESVRRIERVVQVLQVGDRTPFGDEVSLHHALTVQLENAAFGKAATQSLTHLARVSSPSLASSRASATAPIVTPTMIWLASLASWPAPCGPTWMGRPMARSTGSTRDVTLGFAPRHDGERPLLGSDGATGDRGIDMVDVALGQSGAHDPEPRPV